METEIFAGLKVAVIDDSATITRVADVFLSGPKNQPTGIITKIFEDGYEAIGGLYEFMPDIILLDVVMLRIDGYTLCRAIKSNRELKHIKIILLTSKDGVFDKARGMDAGADHYFLKPFNRDSLLELIEKTALTIKS